MFRFLPTDLACFIVQRRGFAVSPGGCAEDADGDARTSARNSVRILSSCASLRFVPLAAVSCAAEHGHKRSTAAQTAQMTQKVFEGLRQEPRSFFLKPINLQPTVHCRKCSPVRAAVQCETTSHTWDSAATGAALHTAARRKHVLRKQPHEDIPLCRPSWLVHVEDEREPAVLERSHRVQPFHCQPSSVR